MFINDLFNKKQLNESLRDGEYVTFRVFFDDGTEETLNFGSDDIDWDQVGAKRNKQVVDVKRLGGIQGSQSDTPDKPHDYPDDRGMARAQKAYDRQVPESRGFRGVGGARSREDDEGHSRGGNSQAKEYNATRAEKMAKERKATMDALTAAHKKKQGVSEAKADPTGSWVVYDGGKVKRFKSREGAKAYAEKNGGKVASSEYYADNIQKQGVAEGFDDLDRFMKAKYGPKPSGGAGIKRGTYGQPGRARGRKKGELSGAFHQGGGSDIPHNVGFDRSDSERSAGRRMPRFSDDYDSIKRSEVDEGSVQDRLHQRHQEIRKKAGRPDPDYYKELKKTYDMPDDERWARTAELKKKYKVTNEDREQYIEELGRAGYEIVNERRMTCPECGGAAYADRMLAEKQDACYHKVKSRYKVWPSAYASGALVRCRKKGAANWGNKSKK